MSQQGQPATAPPAVQPIVDLAITSLPTHSNSEFQRFATIANPAYLWCRRADAEPVTEVKVVYGGGAAEAGWVKVAEDLNSSSTNSGPSKRVHIWYRKGGDGSPIIDLKVATSNDVVIGPGFARLEEVLNPDADKNTAKEFLCFKTKASQAKLDAAEYKEGDEVDAKDTANNWCVARIMGVDGDKVLVHYKGWSEKWDEWLDRKSKRIAPFRSKTMGRATGWEGDKEAFLLKEKEKEFNEIDKRSEELETKMESKDFKEFTKDEIMYLSAQQNYAYVLNCLNAIVDDPELLPRVHNFLQRQLKFVIRFLVHEPEIPGQVLESLVKIFSGDHQYRRFYTKYGVKGTEKDVGGKFAVRAAPPQNPADDKVVIVSSYLIALLNWFGDNGGFEAITDRLTNDKWQDSFFNVALILKALGASKGNWNPKFGPKFVASLDLQKLLPARLRKITDLELKTLTKDGIVEMVRDVEGLMTLSVKAQTIAEIMEKVSLDMSLRLLTAKVLEKRLNGCVGLEETITRVWRKERAPYVAHGQAAGGQGQGQAQEVAPAKYLTSKMLVEWIEENKVVEIFLGANSHEQIIKRSPMLLKFLASNNALTVNHVDLLWSSSIDKHEGLVRIVYDTLADLAQELADEQLDALYKRITVVNFTEYTDFVLNFIKNFTINAVKATAGKNKWYGLDLFWKIVQDDVKVTNQIANQASGTLKELLEQPQFEAQRLVYLDACLLGVREGKSVVQCLRLAKVIISMFPVQSHSKQVYSMEELLVAMEERQQVLGLLLNDLVRYNAATKKLLAGPEGKSADQKDPTFFGRHPHSLQIATRLDFLDFVLSHSPLQLNQQAIDALWENFVTGGVLPEDKGFLLDWFNQAVNDEGRRQFPIFNDEVAKYLFTNLLCNAQKLDFASLSKKGYECFETYFININYAAQCLLTTSRKYMAVTDYAKLVGMDALWQIASWAADSDVASSAKKFLATCHIRLDFKFTPAEKKQIFKSFVDRTMAGLTEASKAIQANRDQERMKRQANALLDLLENFLTRCEAGETIEKPRFTEGENVRATWKGGARIYEAKIMSVNREGTYVVRYSDGDMDKNCPESSIMPLSDKPEEKKKPDDDTQLYPKFILSNEKKYFDLLFELLEVGGELGPKVWKLLERLPTNQDLSARIKQLNVKDSAGKIAWDTLLPSKSVIKLLYSMQIIDQTVQVPDNNEPAKKEMAEWCNIFVTQGGFAHMYRILATVDEKQMIGEPLPQQCLNFLIKLSNFFLSGTGGLDASLAHAAVEHSKLMGKLMSVMAALSEAKSEEVKKPTKKVQVSEERESRQPLVGPMRPPPPLAPDAAGSEGQPGGADAAAANQAAAADDNLSQMVTNTCNLITSVAGPKHESLEAVYKFAGWKDIITNGLLRNGNPAFRTRLANGIHVICSKFNKLENPKPPRVHFLSVLLACLPNLDTQSGAASNSNDYFQLVQTLLKGSKTEDGSFDPQSLSLHLSEKIKTHPVVERRVEDTDVVLCGLFMLAQVLLSKVPALKEPLGSKHGLMEDIYHCLFDVPSTTSRGKRDAPPPKCKSPRSRKLAFALMVELAKECPANSKALIALLVQNHIVSHSGGTHPEDWNFEAKTEEKSDAGYVGLKNLGCICYMNALMQQLFMVPKLRSNLLAVDLEKEEDKKESVLYQLQYIFALLQESEKMYANPEGFCYAFKDFDGKPTNVSIQEDAAGFYSRLLDKIDEQVKTTEWRDCVKEVLGGTLSHELIGQRGCTHYKEREETFYTVTLQVQNKKNMQESLQAFVQGEMLEGENAYKCGQCGKKVDTLKRTCLKALPPTIAFVLKRFALDYNTMQTTKLNDRLEFPMIVDLKPFCKESLPIGNVNEAKDTPAPEGKGAAGDGKTPAAAADKPVNRPDDYYKYELKGVCVHTGGASHGHYYSFIRERLIGDDPEADAGGRWYEFNDTIVRPFDPKDIPNECFGGAESRRSMGQYSGMGNPANTVQGPTVVHEKSRSAYVLFYDRVKPKKVAETPAVVADSKLSLAGAAASVLFHNKMKKINEGQRALARVHPKIFNQIWGQNLTYWRDKAVFDHGYFEFLQDLILGDEKERLKDGDDSSALTPAQVVAKHSGPVKAEASDSVKLATYFVFNTLSRAFHKNALSSWMPALRRMYSSVPACAWLLETMTSTTWNFEFLLGCNDPDVRQQVSALICQALSTLSPLEQGSYDQPLPAKASPVPETKEGKEKETKEKAPQAGTSSEVKDDRGFVVKYIDSAVRFLRSAPEHWKSFEPLFRVLSHFASLGIKEARYIGDKHNFVAKLIDFYLGDESPMPQVGEMATDANGKRRVMGDNWNSPDFTYVLQLLRTLICSFGTDTFGKDKPQLPQTGRELLLSKQFLPRLLQDATSRKRGKSVADVVAHWCTENEKLSQTIVATIAMGIENNSYDAARAYFRVLMTLVQLKDSVQPKRVEWILQSLLSVMSNQQKYWKITDFCIEHLIRMAKKSEDCYRWLHAHPQQFEWIFTWIKTNPKPPRGFDQNEATQLHKPGKGPSEQQMMQQMSQWNVQGHMAYPTHVGLPPAKKLQALQLIKDGTPLDRDEASDSDVDLADREFEVGQWVDALDTANKWLCGQIVDVTQGKIRVHYDGWSEKWNVWFDKSSIKVQTLAKHSNKGQLKARGKKQKTKEGQTQASGA